MAVVDVRWYCLGDFCCYFFPGNKYFNPYSERWFDFCNCGDCFALGDLMWVFGHSAGGKF